MGYIQVSPTLWDSGSSQVQNTVHCPEGIPACLDIQIKNVIKKFDVIPNALKVEVTIETISGENID